MRRLGLIAAIAAALPLADPGQAATQTEPSPPAGYLAPAAIQALADAVPAPPPENSARALADRAASDRMRALEDTDRWLLARRQAELRPGLALSHFDCALGFRLTAEGSPRLVGLLERLLRDIDQAAETAKARSHRPRPVALDPDRDACQVVSAAGRASPSHPSGSAAVGVAYGETLAALAPDRAAQARRIGHEIGVSRTVCAMHFPSDVEAGQALGAAVYGAMAGTPAFAADMAAARQELDRARRAALTSPACAAERAALATPLP